MDFKLTEVDQLVAARAMHLLELQSAEQLESDTSAAAPASEEADVPLDGEDADHVKTADELRGELKELEFALDRARSELEGFWAQHSQRLAERERAWAKAAQDESDDRKVGDERSCFAAECLLFAVRAR